MTIIFVHGFNANGYSTKSMQLRAHFTKNKCSNYFTFDDDIEFFKEPKEYKLFNYKEKESKYDFKFISETYDYKTECPAEIINRLETTIQNSKDKEIFLIGSSMGGFYVRYISKKYGIPSLNINPLTKPNFFVNFVIPVEYVWEMNDYLKELNGKLHYDKLNVFVSKDDNIINPEKTIQDYKYCSIYQFHKRGHRFENFPNTFHIIEEIIKKYYTI